MKTENKIREIYQSQHERVSNSSKTMERFINMTTEEYFGLGKGWFKGKKILDAGCGNTGKMMITFNRFGCTDLTGMDIGNDFKKPLESTLSAYHIPKHTFKALSGSILNIPCKDNTFDFTCCQGVLYLMPTDRKLEHAFEELARVTKPGGFLYITAPPYGGLMNKIIATIREHYIADKEFKDFIDNINIIDMYKTFAFIESEMLRVEVKKATIPRNLFDEDLCVTIQNVIQTPISRTMPPEQLKGLFKYNNFTDIRRLKRYVKYNNIRRYLSPLYFNHQHKMSRILYGSGALDFIGRKI